MAGKLTSETRRLYSWWWDSHISPKNSKWLQENLTDLDSKVKAMIKIINEDADSFARRAEMYYKKRPELMKLVEEFYRAYRALAERYDHATGELRLAHRTMIEAFPNQVPFMLSDDPSSGSEPPSPIASHLEGIFDPDDLNKASDVGFSKRGFKQLNEIFKSGEAVLRELKTAEGRLRGNIQGDEDRDSSLKHGSSQLSDRNHSLDLRTMILNESERAAKVEAEMQRLKQALAKMEAERDAVLAQYRDTLEKLSTMEKELNSAQVDAKEVEKCATEAQGEVKALKESLKKLELERDSSFYQLEEASKRISSLEAMAAAVQGDAANWRGQAVKAETESQSLKQDLSRSEAEKQDALARYQQSLDKISALEERLRRAEENAERLSEQNEQAASEIKALKEEISRLNREKEDAFLRYQQCLDMIAKLQNELMEAKEEARRLNDEILFGSDKLKVAEDQCALLEEVNQSLKLEANDLVQEIAAKDQQLAEKHTELEKLMNRLQDEESQFTQVEATLHKLQDMHLQSQEDQRALASELRDGLHMLKDLELCKRDLELEIQCLREENRELTDMKSASSAAEKDMQHEILGLKEIKEKLEANVRQQAEGNEVLQQQFHRLKEELEDLYKKYQDLLKQLEAAGIDPNCIKSSIKDLQDKKSMHLGRLESSLSDVKVELESSKEKMKALQESCNALSGDKSSLVAEKSALLSQLQIITESMQKLLEKNALLENSLQSANIQLEGLRVKSRSLEDFCQFLKEERSSLQTERCNLVYRLECVEKKLEKLEARFTRLEDKYAGLEKERDSTRNQVDELMISLVAETKEHRYLVLTSEARLSGLEDRIHDLQEENKHGKKDFEEQLEKAVSAQVEIFVLKKFMKDMEERKQTLLEECQRHAEASEYSERLISELESENMMQHLETEYLLDKVDKLRRGICQVLKALEIDHVSDTDPEVFLPRVRGNIKDMRRYLSESKDESQELLIQNNVLSTVIRELSLEGLELKTRKDAVDHELFILSQKHAMLDHEKDELVERSGQLELVVAENESRHETLKAEIRNLGLKQESLEKEHSDVLKENRLLQDKLRHVEEEKDMLEERNSSAIMEALSLGNQSVVFESSWVQTLSELRRVAQDMCHLREAYSNLESETRAVKGKLAMKETENIELHVCNEELNQQFLIESERLNRKEAELLEAEQRIETIQDVNTELNTTIEGLQVQCKALDDNRGNLELQIFELSKCREHQDKEIGLLQESNGSLENEVAVLCREIEACRIREVVLHSELHEMSSEFELWEAEATSFYFDLQISSVREALLKNKVQELSGLCEDLQGSGTRKNMEIENLKNRISFLESESEELKSKLDAYVRPANTNQQVAELMVPESRGKAIRTSVEDRLQAEIKLEAATKEIKEPKCRKNSLPNVTNHGLERKDVNLHSRSRDGTHMKDIPLDYISDASPCSHRRRKSSRLSDQLLGLWEASELDSSHNSALRTRARTSPPRRKGSLHRGDSNPEIEKELGVDKLEVSKKTVTENRKAILERLASDAQKLASLQASVQELRRKMEINKRSKFARDVEYRRLKGQLQNLESSMVQLVSVNTEVSKTMKGSSSSSDSARSREAVEQSRRDSERIGSLQLEMQKIQSMLVKLEEEKNSIKKGGKSGLSRIRTGIFLREFVYGRSRSRKQKKSRFCGCFRPSHKEV